MESLCTRSTTLERQLAAMEKQKCIDDAKTGPQELMVKELQATCSELSAASQAKDGELCMLQQQLAEMQKQLEEARINQAATKAAASTAHEESANVAQLELMLALDEASKDLQEKDAALAKALGDLTPLLAEVSTLQESHVALQGVLEKQKVWTGILEIAADKSGHDALCVSLNLLNDKFATAQDKLADEKSKRNAFEHVIATGESQRLLQELKTTEQKLEDVKKVLSFEKVKALVLEGAAKQSGHGEVCDELKALHEETIRLQATLDSKEAASKADESALRQIDKDSVFSEVHRLQTDLVVTRGTIASLQAVETIRLNTEASKVPLVCQGAAA